MSQSNALKTQVERIESKASDYETATNFEAKKQKYLNELSSLETVLGGLERRVDKMEFLTSVLVDVLGVSEGPPSKVKNARSDVESVVNHDIDYYYELVEEGEKDQYEGRVQQAKSNVDEAIKTVEKRLQQVERDWKERVDAARNVQRLFGDSRDMTSTFNEIESFVDRRMKDDSESISTLQSDWQGLQKSWERSSVDWDTFRKEYGLSERTIEILQELADGNDLKLGQLNEKIAKELLSVDDLQDVVKLTV